MLIAWKKAKLGRKIVFYSLQLSDEQKQELRAICDLEIRELDFRAYPSHIFNLLNYAFKVVAIVDAYSDFDFFHVMDASIRPNNVTLLREYWDDVRKGKVPPFSIVVEMIWSKCFQRLVLQRGPGESRNKIIRQWSYTDSIKVKRGDGHKGPLPKDLLCLNVNDSTSSSTIKYE
ncbi:unnamed protein product, partial [Mesorhabditis belari]|uniref:Uncharacterized protein n=1 Tax=Mesorhabditis belari TaxID=2138241 RepID=A0AAF3F9N5_9BILA